MRVRKCCETCGGGDLYEKGAGYLDGLCIVNIPFCVCGIDGEVVSDPDVDNDCGAWNPSSEYAAIIEEARAEEVAAYYDYLRDCVLDR